MSTIVLASARCSPGVTTLAVTLAGALPSGVLVEADPAGGVLAVRYGLGREPGLGTLAASRSSDPDTLLRHAQRLPGGLPAVVAPESAEGVAHLLTAAGDRLAHRLTQAEGHHVVVDAGRFLPGSPALPLLRAASLVVVVARPWLEGLLATADRLRALARVNPAVGLALVGRGPYSEADVAAQLGCEVLATVAEDGRAAVALSEGGSRRALARSPLVRTTRALAERITDRLAVTATATTSSDPERTAVGA